MRKKLVSLFLIIIIISFITGCQKKTDDKKLTSEEELTKCEGNLKNLAKACEIYASHNNNHYPQKLEDVNPYIKNIPVCPSCKKPYIYTSQSDPDFFIIKCAGPDAHKETGLVGEGNYPLYTSREGLIIKGDYVSPIPRNNPSVKPPVTETSVSQKESPSPEITPAVKEITPLQATKNPRKIDQKASEHNSKGLEYMEQKKYDQALEEFNKAIEIDPDYVEAIKNKGNVYYYKDDTDKALESYELTVSKDPSYWNGYNNIGNVYYSKGTIDKAEEYYSKAAGLCNNDIKPYNNLVGVLVEEGKYQNAIDTFEKAGKLGLKSAELYSQAGYSYWQIAQDYIQKKDTKSAADYTNKAMQDLSKASEMDPNDPVPYFRGGIICFNLGPKYFDKAIDCMNKAIDKKGPDTYKYLYSRGQVYEGKEDKEKARKDYEQALPLAQKAKDKDMIKKIEDALGKINSGKG